MTKRGFTLLEILLVVGVASVLIIGGITLYGLIDKNRKISETVTLVNVIATQVRKMYANSPTYGTEENIEAALYNSQALPEKYKSRIVGHLASPYQNAANSVRVIPMTAGWPRVNVFQVVMILPPNVVPYVAIHFDPSKDTSIWRTNYCRAGDVQNGQPLILEDMISVCGSSDEMTGGGYNFSVYFK